MLPPGIFIIILFLASLYAKKFKWFFFSSAVVFYLLSNSYVSDMLLSPLESPYNKQMDDFKEANAVVVLGGGRIKGSVNLPLSQSAFKRAMWGMMIAKKENLPLIFTGGGVDKSYSEANAFKETLKEISKYLGIKFDKEKLFVESKSLNTLENAKYTKELLEKMDIKKPVIILVTSAYHMKRALLIYKKFGFTTMPSATDFLINSSSFNFFKLLPNIHSFEKSYIALHEYFGLLSLYIKK
jgi:uncharacterized SAM-binding protein YcdF (DUF218 family)